MSIKKITIIVVLGQSFKTGIELFSAFVFANLDPLNWEYWTLLILALVWVVTPGNSYTCSTFKNFRRI